MQIFQKNILNFKINQKILRGISERKLCRKFLQAGTIRKYLKVRRYIGLTEGGKEEDTQCRRIFGQFQTVIKSELI